MFNKMNRNLITVMFFVFMAVKNPLGFTGVKIAQAEPQGIETNAIGEADIAANINNVNKTNRLPRAEEQAKNEMIVYQKLLAEERARKEAEQAKIKAAEEARKTTQYRPQRPVTAKGNFEAIYAEAEKRYSVSRYLLAAVHMVESGQRGDTSVASYAGAQGPMQFMPSTFRAYAQDGDGDGIASINDAHDAIFTAAKYLAANGAASGNVTAALYRYNHSYSYVYHVLSVARSFGFAG